MSVINQRLISAIRRVSKTDPDIANSISASQSRGGYDGAAARGESSSDSQICCDGSTSENANPGMSMRNPDDGDQDGLDPDDPANLNMGPGSLTGLTDCDTGEPVCFEGGDWVPPEGWDDPQDPPVEEGYQEGYYWDINGQAEEDYQSLSPDGACFKRYHVHVQVNPDNYTYAGISKYGEGIYECVLYDTTTGITSVFAQAYLNECSGQSVCEQQAPREDSWPSDSCVNLAIKRGKIVGSKYDPENDGSYNAPRDSISLCDGNGNQVDIAPSADGGWKSISPNNPNDGYLYDSQGRQIDRISDSEYNDPNV